MVSSQDLVATLVAHPAQPVMTDRAVAAVMQALGQETECIVLARGIAADLVLPGAKDGKEAENRARQALEDLPVDVIVQPLSHRRKRLFLADMDSTMIGQECIDELA